jgi:hypothetical protein
MRILGCYLLYFIDMKFLNVFIPTIASFFVLAALLKLEDKYHSFLFTTDPNFDPGPLMEVHLFIILGIPFLFALIFQALGVLPFWTRIKSDRKVYGLRLWQILSLTAFLFGLVLMLARGISGGFSMELFISSFVMTFMFTVYWVTNFITLVIIDKIKLNQVT